MSDPQTPAPDRKPDGSDWFGAIGLALVSVGVGCIYWPAGVICAGLSFLLLAWVSAQAAKAVG